jgi:hydrogenase maturation protease
VAVASKSDALRAHAPDMATPVLIAGVGYRFLRDMSVGPFMIQDLREADWPEHVEIDDWSFGPIAIVQRLEDQPGYYGRVVLVASVERGHEPGTVSCYRWGGGNASPDEIQERIGEAVMGVISLDNLLIICQHFGVLPPETIVVEIEPEDTGWGDGFTPRIESALPVLRGAVRRAAMDGIDE